MKYRLGWPLGRVFARAGVPTLIRVNVVKDEEAGVYVGTSDDLRGLVLEANTFEELVKEAHELIPCLLENDGHEHLRAQASIRYADELACA